MVKRKKDKQHYYISVGLRIFKTPNLNYPSLNTKRQMKDTQNVIPY